MAAIASTACCFWRVYVCICNEYESREKCFGPLTETTDTHTATDGQTHTDTQRHHTQTQTQTQILLDSDADLTQTCNWKLVSATGGSAGVYDGVEGSRATCNRQLLAYVRFIDTCVMKHIYL